MDNNLSENTDDVQIHETAVVDSPVWIGNGTKIWHFCHVMAGAHIGARCVLGQNTFVAGTVKVGNDCHIQNNVSLYDGVVLEDEVFLGPSCVFTNVRRPRSCISQRNCFVPTLVKRGATLGANSTIVAGVTIGLCAFIGAGCVVLASVPDYALVVGNPARTIGWVSRAGERLVFEGGIAFCARTHERYVLCNGRVALEQ
jgi:UDP-2-acetamido-3-amino-2,3-dideoxy-glucuronate N-acetyltransferase